MLQNWKVTPSVRWRPQVRLQVVALGAVSLLAGCLGGGGGGGGGDGGVGSGLPPIPSGPPSPAEQALNDLLRAQYPGGSEAGGGRMVDPTIDLASGGGGQATPSGSLERLPVAPGGSIAPGIGYTSPTAPVDAICIGFGSPDNAWCIPANDPSAVASGTGEAGAVAAPLAFPPELCGMLSQICHDIRCYEFARTGAGTFSRANINLLAFACGQCDEPSCQQLISSCEPEPGQCTDSGDCEDGQECVNGQCVGTGVFRITLSWSSANDLDLWVITPSGTQIDYTNRTADSGSLDVDNTSGGSGSVENVFFTAPLDGQYQVIIDNFGGPSASYRLEVAKRGTVVESVDGSVAEGAQSSPLIVGWP